MFGKGEPRRRRERLLRSLPLVFGGRGMRLRTKKSDKRKVPKKPVEWRTSSPFNGCCGGQRIKRTSGHIEYIAY